MVFTLYQEYLLSEYRKQYRNKVDLQVWIKHIEIILYHMRKGIDFEDAIEIAKYKIPLKK